jgi:hypothetical protein
MMIMDDGGRRGADRPNWRTCMKQKFTTLRARAGHWALGVLCLPLLAWAQTPPSTPATPAAPASLAVSGAVGEVVSSRGVWAQASRGRHNTPSAQCPARARRVVNYCFMQVLQLGRSAARRPPSSMIIMPLQQARNEPESGYCVRRPNRCPTRNRRIAPGSVKFDA